MFATVVFGEGEVRVRGWQVLYAVKLGTCMRALERV